MRTRALLAMTLLSTMWASDALAATTTVPVAADASIESQNPTTNFGSGLLRVDGDPQRWALLQYQVPALSGTVTDVKLRVYKRVGSPSQVMQVQSSPCTWTYSTVTWNTRPTLGSVIATATHPAAEGWVAFTLPTTSVSQGTRCFALTKAASADVWITADDMDAVNPSQLVITTQTDVTPPDTTITAGPSGSTTATDASFSFISTESGSTFACALDGAAFASCSSPRAYTGLAVGSHTFSVRATDAAGNPDPTPATRTWSVAAPPAGYCDSSAVTGAWTGTGATITVSPGQTIQTAVDAASAGDTVLLRDGDYGKQSVTITKAIRLKAEHRFGAHLWGTAPTVAGDATTGTAVTVRGAGMMVDGLDMRYYATGIDTDNSGPFTLQNNWLQGMSSAGIQVFDARQPLVQCNVVLDLYLSGDPVSTSPTQPSPIANPQSDYGVNFYGATDPVATHNYFGGVFSQSLSFKEGNRNPTATYNTFEGSSLTAMIFGQNGPHNGPYDYSGLPNGPDFGTLTAHHNVFREVYDFRGTQRVVYYVRSPMRVWHVNGTTNLSDNIVESSAQGLGIVPECRVSGDAGCAAGTVNLARNTVSGAVQDGATIYQVASACDLAVDSWSASNAIPVSMTNQTCVSASPVVSGNGAFMFSQSGTRSLTTPIPTLRRLTPTVADPDLSYHP
jgi:hypothetical protein